MDQAIENYETAMNFYEEHNLLEYAAMTGLSLGPAYRKIGKYKRAEKTYFKALSYWRAKNNSMMVSNILNNLGVLFAYQGQYIESIENLEEALSLAKTIGQSRLEALILASIGDVYSELASFDAAINSYERAYSLATDIGYQFLRIYAACVLGNTFLVSGNLPRGRSILLEMQAELESCGSNYERALINLSLGHLARYEQDYDQAIDYLTLADQLFSTGEQLIEQIAAKMQLVATFSTQENWHLAKKYLDQAVQISGRLDNSHAFIVAAYQDETSLRELSTKKDLSFPVQNLIYKIEVLKEKLQQTRQHFRARELSIQLDKPKIRIHTLGTEAIFLGEKALTNWGAPVQRDLFLCVLAHPRGLTKEQLGAIFWPDCSPAQLAMRFKKTIYRLRRTLGAEILVFENDRYYFNTQLDYEFDVEAFWRNIKAAKSATDDENKAKFYRKALAKYTGPFLPRFDYDWARNEREKIIQAYVNGIRFVSTWYLRCSDYSASLNYAQIGLEVDICDETFHRQIMRIYAQMDTRSKVIRQYELCCQALNSELGVKPVPKTTKLFNELTQT